jgi:hypothetical protein
VRLSGVVPNLPIAPKTRADCIDGPRPCPWNRCRYHLERADDFPDCDSTRQGQDTCALDVAGAGGLSLAKLAVILGDSPETIRQTEIEACKKLGLEFEQCT